MGNVIQSKVITREGELDITITLNLNIALTQNGETHIEVAAKPVESKPPKTELEIPDFETPVELVDFG